MLTVSRCSHILPPKQQQPAAAIDLTLLDLNKLSQIGTMYTNIKPTALNNGLELCTLAKYDYDEKRMELREIRSTVDTNFQLKIEARSEISRFGGIKSKKEWSSSLTCQPHTAKNAYLFRCNRSNDIGDAFEEQQIHDAQPDVPFILEGIGMIRKRYWAMTGFVGTIAGQTINVRGEPCRVIYYCGRRRVSSLNGREVEIVKIKQETVQPNGASDISISVYMASGHLLRHKFEWFGGSFVVHMDPLGMIPPEPVPIDFSLKDMNRFLYYLQERANVKALMGMGEYVHNNRHVRNLVQFYVLKLIEEKPKDVLEFTIRYFMKLGIDKKFDNY